MTELAVPSLTVTVTSLLKVPVSLLYVGVDTVVLVPEEILMFPLESPEMVIPEPPTRLIWFTVATVTPFT